MRFKNIDFIGSSHIARQSVKDVRDAIENTRPDIVALELDEDRAYALLHEKEQEGKISWAQRRQIGWKGYYFAKFGHWAEAKLGKMVGMKPGSEMKEAMVLANKNHIPIVFVDQHISKTLKRLSKELTWREKARIAIDVVGGFFRSLVGKPEFEIDLSKVPQKDLMDKMMAQVRKRYPNIYKVLVTERNEYMAKKLFLLHNQVPDKRVLAVLGAGHVEEIMKLLERKSRTTDVIHYQNSFSVNA
jgi:pheromone shutdown-related protein TraB